MWTDQLMKVILRDCLSASVLTGIYAINTLPVRVQFPAALIVNLSSSSSGGSHWTAIYINENARGFYFDTFARPPPKQIVTFLKRNCKLYQYNKIQVQDNTSTLCGLFCIVFIYFSVRRVNIIPEFNTVHLKKK